MGLIYTNKLLEELRELCRWHAENDGEFSILQRAIRIVHEQPTVDAEPVRHGKWAVTHIYIKCSECGESFPLIPQNYCPNCGAYMKGTEDD